MTIARLLNSSNYAPQPDEYLMHPLGSRTTHTHIHRDTHGEKNKRNIRLSKEARPLETDANPASKIPR